MVAKVVSAGTSAVCLAAFALSACASSGDKELAQPLSSSADRPTADQMRPGCAPFGASLVEQAAPGAATVHSLNGKVNSALTLNAVVLDTPDARYTIIKVIIAVPGATLDVGPVDQLPAKSAGRPENQLSSEVVSAPGLRFSVTAQSPAAPGTYPIVAYGQYMTAIDCNGPVPTDPGKRQTGTYAFEMGTLVVEP